MAMVKTGFHLLEGERGMVSRHVPVARCAPRAEPPGVLRVEADIRHGSAEGGAG
jgi:hypothetical protein